MNEAKNQQTKRKFDLISGCLLAQTIQTYVPWDCQDLRQSLAWAQAAAISGRQTEGITLDVREFSEKLARRGYVPDFRWDWTDARQTWKLKN